KGLLMPRMTTSQMFAIQSPASGLLIYNTSYNQLYQYNGANWLPILNGNYWSKPINNRDVISNTGDSVGIGITLPTQRLDVNGTVRVRNNLLVDDAVHANTLVASGNLVAAGTGVVSGSLQTNDELVVHNSAAIVQLKAAGENKGYMQLSGNDLRIGTNVGNATGNVILRLNGNERMKILPDGTIEMSGNIQRPAKTGQHGLLPIAYGKVSREGILQNAYSTDNVTVTKVATGEYRLVLNEMVPNAIIILSPMYAIYESNGSYFTSGAAIMFNRLAALNTNPDSTVFWIYAQRVDATPWDNSFSFVVYGMPEE
ncbi:MAG: hypothetical protein ACXWV0_05795, partial [Flavisolibacter sp.]